MKIVTMGFFNFCNVLNIFVLVRREYHGTSFGWSIHKFTSHGCRTSWFFNLCITACPIGPKKNMYVYCHMSKKSRVGRSALLFYFILLSAKPKIVVPVSDPGISFSKFPVSRHLFWSCFMRVMQFFYLLCSQFDKKLAVE